MNDYCRYSEEFMKLRPQEANNQDARQESFDLIKEMVQDNLGHFKNAWYFGDGNGGAIWMMIEELVDQTPDYIKNQTPNSKKKISNAKRKRVFENDKYRCKKCGTHKDLSVDHIIPESKGGSSKDENLQTLCKPCNSSKGVKDNKEFMEL